MSVNSKIFNKKYYYDVCLGSEEFKQSYGKNINFKVKKLLDSIDLKPYMEVLEIGCGRGDNTLYLSKRVKSIIGIDYSKDAIDIANSIRKKSSTKTQKNTKFLKMKADKLLFDDESFDMVIMIDTIDHLNDIELNKCMKEISRVLKKNGQIFIKTCSNKTLLNYTYRYYTYPVNNLLTKIDKIIKRIDYDSLPNNPRTKDQFRQHINEPTLKYLKNIFKKYNFEGKTFFEIGYLKTESNIRSKLYNLLIALYPFSLISPLNNFFANSFIFKYKKHK
jgi:ubiquinone/menaquinone biosynthesis C-methylase UbiE